MENTKETYILSTILAADDVVYEEVELTEEEAIILRETLDSNQCLRLIPEGAPEWGDDDLPF